MRGMRADEGDIERRRRRKRWKRQRFMRQRIKKIKEEKNKEGNRAEPMLGFLRKTSMSEMATSAVRSTTLECLSRSERSVGEC